MLQLLVFCFAPTNVYLPSCMFWKVATYKEKLFPQLTGKVEKVLELGIGTGPNLKYYVGAGDRYVIGVDPNKQMEKYARASAEAAGLQSTNFSFIRGV